MKIILAALTLISTSVYAQSRLSLTEQKELVEKMAKEERRQLWISSHDDVKSYVSKLTVSQVQEIEKKDHESEEPLSADQIEQIFACVSAPRTCSLFTIDISSSYMSGTGHDRVWILLDPKTGKARKIRQNVYSE